MQRQSMVELLESRRMLAGVSLKAGVIRVYGDTLADNVITVGNDASGLRLDVSVTFTDAVDNEFTYTASILKTPDLRKFSIYGGDGDDIITVRAGLAARIDAGAGDDLMNLAGERDAVYAGPGDDTVAAAAGNDLVYGETGNDVLKGGAGNDTVLGGSGQNDIEGGKGDDKIGGLLGSPNTLMGGAGSDTFVSASLSVSAPNDFNALEDTLIDEASDTDTPTVTPQ